MASKYWHRLRNNITKILRRNRVNSPKRNTAKPRDKLRSSKVLKARRLEMAKCKSMNVLKCDDSFGILGSPK